MASIASVLLVINVQVPDGLAAVTNLQGTESVLVHVVIAAWPHSLVVSLVEADRVRNFPSSEDHIRRKTRRALLPGGCEALRCCAERGVGTTCLLDCQCMLSARHRLQLSLKCVRGAKTLRHERLCCDVTQAGLHELEPSLSKGVHHPFAALTKAEIAHGAIRAPRAVAAAHLLRRIEFHCFRLFNSLWLDRIEQQQVNRFLCGLKLWPQVLLNALALAAALDLCGWRKVCSRLATVWCRWRL